jgi:molybdate-binding protein
METTFKEWFEKNLAEDAADIARHGADAGFGGITYTSDTVKLFDQYEDEIYQMLADDAEEFGHKNVPEFIATFGRADMAETMSGLKNLLVWYACEKLARELEEA